MMQLRLRDECIRLVVMSAVGRTNGLTSKTWTPWTPFCKRQTNQTNQTNQTRRLASSNGHRRLPPCCDRGRRGPPGWRRFFDAAVRASGPGPRILDLGCGDAEPRAADLVFCQRRSPFCNRRSGPFTFGQQFRRG